MIATAAEANPTVFSAHPYTDLETTFIPSYVRLGKYLNNHWSSTKFCASQFRGEHSKGNRASQTAMKNAITHAKGYDDLDELVGPWTGEQVFAEIVEAIEARNGDRQPKIDETAPASTDSSVAATAATDAATVAATESAQVAEQENSPAVSEGAESATLSTASSQDVQDLKTPVQSHSPDPALLRAPLAPANESRMPVPSLVSGEDVPTPTPSQLPTEAA